jgi:hypothetical protein
MIYIIWRYSTMAGTRNMPWEVDFCSCLAGQQHKVCWHRALVALLRKEGVGE